jgi:Alpha/beta hydrolase domain
MQLKTLGALVLGVSHALAVASASAQVEVPSPKLTGPVPANVAPGDPSHDYTFFTPVEDLSRYGYVEEEYFLEGTANTYVTEPAGQTGSVATTGHPYRTRMVVRRPTSQRAFNGVVLLEWQNVTAGYDLDAHWGASWRHFVDSGYVWVGISAQRVGVHGQTPTEPPAPDAPPAVNNALKAWSPIRYGSLDLTSAGTVVDDGLCYDVFSQAAQSIRQPGDVNPLGNLKPELIFAIGASQSAGRLSVYHNAIHPLHGVVDAFYLLVGGSGLRTDLPVKVFQYLSETDVRSPERRMPDSEIFRSWEVAGTSHSSYTSDQYRSPHALRDFGSVTPPMCDLPPYSRVAGYRVIDAQYDLLTRWVREGVAPPSAPKLEFTADAMPVIARNEQGIALGGIRLPEVTVPTALNTGVNTGTRFCGLYGTHQPFDDATLAELYPSKRGYVRAVLDSARSNVSAGYLLPNAVRQYAREAFAADIPPSTAEAAPPATPSDSAPQP